MAVVAQSYIYGRAAHSRSTGDGLNQGKRIIIVADAIAGNRAAASVRCESKFSVVRDNKPAGV